MSSVTSLRRCPVKFAHAGLLLSSLLLPITPLRAYSQGKDSAPATLEVVLLLDRSPSANAKKTSGRPFIEDRAQKLLSQLYSLCQFHGVDLRYGAANFGGTLGNVRPLADVSSYAELVLPARQQISFTDFRTALRFGLETLRQEPRATRSLRILFLLTDAEPWPASGILDSEGKVRYFGVTKAGSPASLAALTRDLDVAEIDFYVIALNDRPADELHWLSLLPTGHYLSNRVHRDLDDAIRLILLRLLGTECGQSTLAGTGPLGIREVYSAAQRRPHIALPELSPSRLGRPWYEITIALAGMLFGLMLPRIVPHSIVTQSAPLSTTEIESPPENDDVEELRRRGRTVAPTDPEKARELFERALEKTEQIAQEGEELAAAQIPAIFREILTTVFRENLLAQRRYIYQQAEIKSSRQRAKGLAPVLVERWSLHSKLMIEEFFALQHHARGDEILQALSEFEPPSDWTSERLTLTRIIRDLATTAVDLRTLAEFYHG
jgi:hypothetical protein